MNFVDLNVFKHVANLQSVSLAAKELHMTQPAVTHIINKLEKRYSLTLFHRSRQGTMLTEDGKEFLTCVDQLLLDYEKLEHTAFQLKNKGLYKISLATYPSVTVYCLAECMQLGSFDHKKYALAVKEGSGQEVSNWLASGSADFSISVKEQLVPGFSHHLLGADPYVIVSSKSVPANLTKDELQHYPFIMPLSGCKEVLEPYFKKNHIVINKIMESDSISSTLALTLQLNGITAVPISGLNKQIIDQYTIQPIAIDIQRELIMQWSPKKESDSLFMSFVEDLSVQLQNKKANTSQ
jgi:LysR family transcriptional regulator, tdc operon transcriptional activator